MEYVAYSEECTRFQDEKQLALEFTVQDWDLASVRLLAAGVGNSLELDADAWYPLIKVARLIDEERTLSLEVKRLVTDPSGEAIGIVVDGPSDLDDAVARWAVCSNDLAVLFRSPSVDLESPRIAMSSLDSTHRDALLSALGAIPPSRWKPGDETYTLMLPYPNPVSSLTVLACTPVGEGGVMDIDEQVEDHEDVEASYSGITLDEFDRIKQAEYDRLLNKCRRFVATMKSALVNVADISGRPLDDSCIDTVAWEVAIHVPSSSADPRTLECVARFAFPEEYCYYAAVEIDRFGIAAPACQGYARIDDAVRKLVGLCSKGSGAQ